jgi:hypothetical protein
MRFSARQTESLTAFAQLCRRQIGMPSTVLLGPLANGARFGSEIIAGSRRLQVGDRGIAFVVNLAGMLKRPLPPVFFTLTSTVNNSVI